MNNDITHLPPPPSPDDGETPLRILFLSEAVLSNVSTPVYSPQSYYFIPVVAVFLLVMRPQSFAVVELSSPVREGGVIHTSQPYASTLSAITHHTLLE